VASIFVCEGNTEGRTKSKLNHPEAKKITSYILKMCKDEKYKNKTIGAISLLGKDQANLIERYLLANLGPEEMENHQITCGDAYDFQGDERDVVFLSMVISPSDKTSALTGRRYEQRYNVAASRARDQILLVHSVKSTDIANPECLRRKMLEWFENPNREDCFSGNGSQDDINLDNIKDLKENMKKPPQPFDSWFEVEVFDIIKKRGYRVYPQYEIGGYKVDLVVEGKNNRLAVECDGDRWHGRDRYEYDMSRQRQLERCGWKFWRITGSAFYNDKENSLDSLWRDLDKMEIFPSETEPKNNIIEDNTQIKILNLDDNGSLGSFEQNIEKKTYEELDLFKESNISVDKSLSSRDEKTVNRRILDIMSHPQMSNISALNKALSEKSLVEEQGNKSQKNTTNADANLKK
jgi:very-short-patch-repair endonuclease